MKFSVELMIESTTKFSVELSAGFSVDFSVELIIELIGELIIEFPAGFVVEFSYEFTAELINELIVELIVIYAFSRGTNSYRENS